MNKSLCWISLGVFFRSPLVKNLRRRPQNQNLVNPKPLLLRKMHSGTKKEHKPKLLSPDIFRWGRGLPGEGVGGQKVRHLSRNPGKQNFWAGYPGIFAGISQGHPKSLRKKKLCSIFGPYTQKTLAISEPLHCGLRVRWKVASDLRFRVAMSEPETPSFCGISGDLASSTRKSLAIAISRTSSCPFS